MLLTDADTAIQSFARKSSIHECLIKGNRQYGEHNHADNIKANIIHNLQFPKKFIQCTKGIHEHSRQLLLHTDNVTLQLASLLSTCSITLSYAVSNSIKNPQRSCLTRLQSSVDAC